MGGPLRFPLATGDFNGDGFADLAAGIISEDLGPKMDAGAVQVLYGSASGLTATGNQFLTQDTAAERGPEFGYALAAGDYNGDRIADLDIGVIPQGAVNILLGSEVGLVGGTGRPGRFWHQGIPGVRDRPEDYDSFGAALAAGNFNGDGFADLAVGVPWEDIGGISTAGAANVLYGSGSGLSSAGGQFLHQGKAGIEDEAEYFDTFGWSLAAR